MYKIVLTGGGTAGHVWPLVSIAQALRKELPCELAGCHGSRAPWHSHSDS
ncbi:glycosyltransferase [Candidatus Berkelbacteria bacterium]|nr:glycosyltransferase [Candidatus Berkelbacteria bacterium]